MAAIRSVTQRPRLIAATTAILAAGWLAGAVPAVAATAGPAASHGLSTRTEADRDQGAGAASTQPACAARPARGVTACQISVEPGRAGAARAGAAQPAQSGSTPVGYGPAQIEDAYQLPAASAGSQMTVAVIAPYDDPDVASDLAVYRTQYNTVDPPCPQTLSKSQPQCLTVLSESGALITPGSGTAPPNNASWSLATSAQLDAISAACPNCKILLVEVNSPAITDIGAGVNFAVEAGAQVITIGDAEPEVNTDPTWDSAYFSNPGVVITAAAGNGGYSTSGVDYPAASPDVTAVGGTTLTPSGTGTCTAALAGPRGWCEQAWNDSASNGGATTSACSLYETEPSWQKADLPAGDTGCGSLRTVADVSADADPATGIAVYDSDGEGDWQASPIGGTSVAAAIVAGAYALAGEPASGTSPASFPYAHPGALNDITTGTNTTTASPSCSPAYLCTAGTGYDGPTGLGTPAFTLGLSQSGSESGEIFNGLLEKCMDDYQQGTTNGNKIDIYSCNGTATSQIWAVEANGTIQINGKCLDVKGAGTAEGTLVDLYTCNGQANQQWQPQSGGALLNPVSGMCLGISNGTDENGTQLWIWACDGASTQDWTLPYPVPTSGPAEVTSGVAGECLDNYGGGTTNGDKIDIYTCDGNVGSQQWKVAANGSIQIQTDDCLDVHQSGTTGGTLVDLESCNNTGAQQWRALSDGALLNPESGLCLDVPDNNTANGTQLVINTCDGNATQQWILPAPG